ncbi:TrkH family potassium uptake protein [Paenibacillus hunanensis]|uniref:Trk system potassium uptake protein TrkH n=1 Tax=Paenibacillus hunanensis TaxID=539262 RepID=A0ABU1IUG0_9BACL|nr:TrkH family potassium uptake protein [Paenibacillus hunanensis]MCL9661657.1 TrkH family potassium uptake protein [Paenibacillus hunanensis]MDR6242809.1 trk system potassium uptake protein TrkH [Paenibacillus hunanensis]GGJ02888.1 Ktr system potassium transporter B [Paenibacillus hunanensis]
MLGIGRNAAVRRMNRQMQSFVHPTRLIPMGFAILIAIGTVLLMLPISGAHGHSVGWLNALFMATSAVCVTGLAVIDTGTAFSVFGQVVIMVLIQIGGLGFMTFGILFAVLLGKQIGLKQRLLIQQATNAVSTQGLVKLSLNIFSIAFVLESVAMITLALHWTPELGWKKAWYYGAFYAISSFNNAGFALKPDSLSEHVGDPIVNTVVITLFVIGGLGFIVVTDILRKRRWHKFSLNTKLVLVSSLIATVFGFMFVMIVEWNNPATLAPLSLGDKIWAALFQGVMPRSAGYNTVDIGGLMAATQFVFIMLMFIGAASGSTGGGIKINTFAILLLCLYSVVRGRSEIHAFRRKISFDTAFRALAIIMISLGIVVVLTIMLTITEQGSSATFLEVFYEAVSAFGTVGSSMGLTPHLSPEGKIVVVITMYIGRLGPLALAFALARNNKPTKYSYPEEKVLIG